MHTCPYRGTDACPLLVHVHVHIILEGAGGQFGQLGSIGHCVCTWYSHVASSLQ